MSLPRQVEQRFRGLIGGLTRRMALILGMVLGMTVFAISLSVGFAALGFVVVLFAVLLLLGWLSRRLARVG